MVVLAGMLSFSEYCPGKPLLNLTPLVEPTSCHLQTYVPRVILAIGPLSSPKLSPRIDIRVFLRTRPQAREDNQLQIQHIAFEFKIPFHSHIRSFILLSLIYLIKFPFPIRFIHLLRHPSN